MKKIIAGCLLVAAVAGTMTTTAFARGGCHGGQRYEACAVDGCGLAGVYEYDGNWYCSLYDGTSCIVDGCGEQGWHTHGACAEGTGQSGCGSRWN